MPPKAKSAGKGKEQDKVKPRSSNKSGPNISELCEQLLSSSSEAAAGNSKLQTPGTQPSKRGQAALQLWSEALQNPNKRDDIFKQANACSALLLMLNSSLPDDRHAAAGCLHQVMQSPRAQTDLFKTPSFCDKVLASCSNILQGDHVRSKGPASQLIHLMAQRHELAPRFQSLLPHLINALSEPIPTWAQGSQLRVKACQALRMLIEPSTVEPDDIRQARRTKLVHMGAVQPLIKQLASTKLPLATAASACLRFLALSADFAATVRAEGCMQLLVGKLHWATVEQQAYLCGILWEAAADAEIAEELRRCQALPALLSVVEANTKEGLGKRKKKAKKGGKDKKDKQGAKEGPAVLPSGSTPAQQPPPQAALCNATGALHHLSFLDPAKKELGQLGAAAVLVPLLAATDMGVYQNTVGALWNMGTDPNNKDCLIEAKAPAFLLQPSTLVVQAV